MKIKEVIEYLPDFCIIINDRVVFSDSCDFSKLINDNNVCNTITVYTKDDKHYWIELWIIYKEEE